MTMEDGRAGGERRAMTKKWYIVHAYSNFENKVADAIKDGAKRQGLGDLLDEVVVPTERVIELRRGRKFETDRKLFPGYVFVKMEMTDAAQVMIKNTAKVTGFLGQDNKPKPIADAEAAVMLNRVKDTQTEAPRPTVTFEIGELVKVSAGPFESLNGKVEEVDEERARLKVAVSIFGRETPVELGFAEVQKLPS
jgi:transcription termination/antitermination protein NusG